MGCAYAGTRRWLEIWDRAVWRQARQTKASWLAGSKRRNTLKGTYARQYLKVPASLNAREWLAQQAQRFS